MEYQSRLSGIGVGVPHGVDPDRYGIDDTGHVMFLSNAVGDTLAPGVAIKANSIPKLNALSAVTTWRDIGTACGSLIGGYVLLQLGAEILFGTTAAIVFLFTLKFLATSVLQGFAHTDRV